LDSFGVASQEVPPEDENKALRRKLALDSIDELYANMAKQLVNELMRELGLEPPLDPDPVLDAVLTKFAIPTSQRKLRYNIK